MDSDPSARSDDREAPAVTEPSATPVHDRKARDARGYRWETARPANFLALQHGAYSDRVLAPLVEVLVDDVLVGHPDLTAYPWAVTAWARAEAVAAILFFTIGRRHLLDDPESNLFVQWQVAEKLAIRQRGALGLDPVAHARLVRERAEATIAGFDVEQVIATGREIIDAQVREG
jgi:hypothetical protein